MKPTTPLKGSRTAKITAIVGDDYYDLKLDFGALVELEEKTDRGAFYILRRLSDVDHQGFVGDFRISWIIDIIRIGLVGAGSMNAREAVKFTDRHLREGFVMDYLEVAQNVLYAALHGPEQEPVVFETKDAEPGEPEPEAELTPTPSDASNGENTGNSPEESGSTPPLSEG